MMGQENFRESLNLQNERWDKIVKVQKERQEQLSQGKQKYRNLIARLKILSRNSQEEEFLRTYQLLEEIERNKDLDMIGENGPRTQIYKKAMEIVDNWDESNDKASCQLILAFASQDTPNRAIGAKKEGGR